MYLEFIAVNSFTCHNLQKYLSFRLFNNAIAMVALL